MGSRSRPRSRPRCHLRWQSHGWCFRLLHLHHQHNFHHALLYVLIFILRPAFHGCQAGRCSSRSSFRATNTCLLALEPGRSSTPGRGVVVAFFQVGLVAGLGQVPGAWGPGNPYRPGRTAWPRAAGPGATAHAELPPDLCRRPRGGARLRCWRRRVYRRARGLRLWPGSGGRGNLNLLQRPACRGGWPRWRRARCADGARPGPGKWGAGAV